MVKYVPTYVNRFTYLYYIQKIFVSKCDSAVDNVMNAIVAYP